MKPGKYYVGDLCYVMHDEWPEVCSLLFRGGRDKEGVGGIFTLKDGREFAIFFTIFGDGGYGTNHSKILSVDSGTIGCILYSDLTESERANFEKNPCALVTDIPDEFIPYRNEEGMYFGPVSVDDPESYPEQDYDNEEDEQDEDEYLEDESWVKEEL